MKTASEMLQQTRRMPLVAILRGLDAGAAVEVGRALYAAGFRALEVPLNRPGALQCITLLTRALPEDALVGGGTMLTVADVDAVHAAGGRLMVSPTAMPVSSAAPPRWACCAHPVWPRRARPSRRWKRAPMR